MEELVSTEALDQEILEDARNKASRILKTADGALEAQCRDWETKIQKDLAEIRNSYAERTKKGKEEIFARLPLDKRRLRSETVENFLVKAMGDFLRSLSREALLSVLIEELSQRLNASIDELAVGLGLKPVALYSGLSLSEVHGVLEKLRGEIHIDFLSAVRCEEWDYREDSYVHEFPSIVIDTQSIKISASVEDVAGALLKEKRAELASALLGEGVLND